MNRNDRRKLKKAGVDYGTVAPAMNQEITRQILEQDAAFSMDNDSSILWMLHVHFGFGPKRLKKAWELFYAEHKKLVKHYELSPEDGGWLCRQELKKIGADVEAWYKEEGSKTDA